MPRPCAVSSGGDANLVQHPQFKTGAISFSLKATGLNYTWIQYSFSKPSQTGTRGCQKASFVSWTERDHFGNIATMTQKIFFFF